MARLRIRLTSAATSRLNAALLFTMWLVSCHSSGPQPEITPRIDLNKRSVAAGSAVEVTYSFSTTPQYSGLKKDYIIFVRFHDPRGVIRFIDDHKPPVLSNQWLPAQTYSYTRTIVVPENIPVGTYHIEMGMYQSSGRGERIVLNAPKVSARSYDMGTFQIVPAVPEGDFVRGWYDAESDPQENWYHWRWMSDEGVLRVNNPQSDSILYLKAATDLSRFSQPLRLTVHAGSQIVDEFEVPSGEFLKKYRLTRDQLGSEPTVDITLHMDQTFVPASDGISKDNRKLGLKVFLLSLTKSS